MVAALPYIALTAAVGGQMTQAMGAAAQGNAQAAAYNANAEQQARQGQQQRNIDLQKSQQIGQQNERNAGSIVAAYGAAGVDPNSGSPLEVMSDQATHGELNRQLMLWQGTADQQSADTQAGFDRAQGAAAKQAGYNSALGTLFSGGSKDAWSASGMSW